MAVIYNQPGIARMTMPHKPSSTTGEQFYQGGGERIQYGRFLETGECDITGLLWMLLNGAFVNPLI